METHTKKDATIFQDLQRGNAQIIPGEEASQAGLEPQLVPLIDDPEDKRLSWAQRARTLELDVVEQPDHPFWKLRQCLLKLDTIARQLLDFYQEWPSSPPSVLSQHPPVVHQPDNSWTTAHSGRKKRGRWRPCSFRQLMGLTSQSTARASVFTVMAVFSAFFNCLSDKLIFKLPLKPANRTFSRVWNADTTGL
ncbi:uncharacterized protein LOC144192257 [Stigmatopora nigra]